MKKFLILFLVVLFLPPMTFAAERWQLTRSEQIAADKVTLATLREEPISVIACENHERWGAVQDIYFASRESKSYLKAIGTTQQEFAELRTQVAQSLLVSVWNAVNFPDSSAILQCFGPRWHWVTMQEGGFYALEQSLDATEEVGVSLTDLGVDAWDYRKMLVREIQKSAAEAVRRVTAPGRSSEEDHAICYICSTMQRWDIPLADISDSPEVRRCVIGTVAANP